MNQYYHPYRRSDGDNDKRRSLWSAVLDIVMWAVTAVVLTAMIIIMIGRVVSPGRMWYFSLLGLAAPMVYIAVVLSMLYWIIRWRWTAVFVTGIFVITGLFYAPLYYKLDVKKQYGEPSYDRSSIKILTFNVRYFYDDSRASTIDSVVRMVQRLNPDIVCFQEYAIDNALRNKIAARMKGYNSAGERLDNRPAMMECFSKYRIVDARQIDSLSGSARAMCVDLLINDDTVRVYNAHLQTTSVSPNDNEYISHGQFIADSTRERRFVQIASGLRTNNELRAGQAERLHDDIASSPYPVVLCGDFNDVPVSYATRTASKGLDDTFSRQGHMYAHTFRGFFNTLRIDYIFVSPDFETLSYEVLPTGDTSDHYPVFVRVKQTPKQ